MHLLIILFTIVLVSGHPDLRQSPSTKNSVLLKSTKLTHNKRSLLPRDLFQSLPDRASQSSAIARRNLDPQCTPLPLNNATWMALDIDTYLKNYPNGKKMLLVDYAASVGALNFVCGIGGGCNVAQMCDPVKYIDWYILFSVQQWNTHANVMYNAIDTALEFVKDSLTSMITQLFPTADASAIIHAKQSMAVSAGMTEVAGTITMDTMILLGSATGPIGWAFNLANFGLASGFAIWAYVLKTPPQPVRDGYDVFSQMTWYIDQVKSQAQHAVSQATKKVINSPISSNEGLSGALKGGQYMNPLVLPTNKKITEHLNKVTLALGLNFMLHAMNAFITLGADYCTDKGINGAWPQQDRLSYCRARGEPMFNIVLAKGDKTVNSITNAHLISSLWGFSTELITQVSWDCQHKNNYKFNYNPYKNGSFPKTVRDPCVFNLPVCDCRYPSAAHTRIFEHHKTVASSCRVKGLLPI